MTTTYLDPFGDRPGLLIEGGRLHNSLPEGTPLHAAFAKHDAEAGPQSEKEAVAANDAAIAERLVIRIPASAALSKPIHILHREQGSANRQVRLIVEENATVDILEWFASDTPLVLNHVLRASLARGATVRYASLAAHPANSATTIHRLFELSQGSSLHLRTGEIGDADTHQSVEVGIDGSAASAHVETVALTNQRQEAILTSDITHRAPQSEGRIEHYGVANDESFLAFEGAGRIHRGMHGSVARQSNRGVVLGETSRLDANPLLYIDEHDVDASHGAAIGRIDEEQLYYLMSRGLTEHEAQRLIIEGFLAPLSVFLEDEGLSGLIRETLQTKTGR